MDTLLYVNAVATFGMLGIIWLVQIVHYPSFLDVPQDAFVSFHHNHTRRITPLVLAFMGTEIVTAGMLAPWGTGYSVAFLLCLLTWVCTFAIQVPQHGKLNKRFDRNTVIRLVRGNWIRTAIWSVRSLLLVALLEGELK